MVQPKEESREKADSTCDSNLRFKSQAGSRSRLKPTGMAVVGGWCSQKKNPMKGLRFKSQAGGASRLKPTGMAVVVAAERRIPRKGRFNLRFKLKSQAVSASRLKPTGMAVVD
ncbi:hypothetical protein HUU39_26975 [candidate division KSB1 bacterium]|nr:hypothetical protein [candidate division KSB1 bacterium]